jgi:hypothetical protein
MSELGLQAKRQPGGEMPDRLLTSHAGSLPRPEDLIALNEQRAEGNFSKRGGPACVC